MTKVETWVEEVDDLDRFLASQPETVRQAADDAGEYFQLVRTMRTIRKGHHVKQSTVAKAMATTQSAVSELESLRTDPRIGTLMRYARAVGARLHLRASVEDVVRLEGPDKWRSAAQREVARPRISKGHLRLIESDAAKWRVPA